MEKKPYAAPEVYDLGTVQELTEDHEGKCGGSADSAFPATLSPEFSVDC